MSKFLILSTSSAFLKIQSKSVGCSLKISRYREFLMIKQKEEKSICEVELELKDETNEKIVTTMKIPSRVTGNIQRVRIDALFPLIFQKDEEISYSEDSMSLSITRNGYSLIVTGRLGSDITTPALTDIHSGTIQVETTLVSVSKEILSISSEYFTTMFYGNYKENENEIKTIKQVSKDDFVRFMSIMHKRKFELASVEMGIIALGFADYFGMIGVFEKTVPFLLNKDLPEDLLNKGLELADRIPNNTKILEWVLESIPNNVILLQVLHDSVPNISPLTVQHCLKKIQENYPKITSKSEEIKPPLQYFPDFNSLIASLTSDQVGIQLCLRQGRNYIVNNYFAIPITRPISSKIRVALDDIWPHAPIGVNKLYDIWNSSTSFTREDRGKTHDIDNCKGAAFYYTS